MTKSFTHHEADSSPSDFGPPDRSNGPEMWDDFEDLEVQRLLESEPNDPL